MPTIASQFHKFLKHEHGVVSTEWVVLAAAALGVAVMSSDLTIDSMRGLGGNVSYVLTGIPDEAYLNFDLINGGFEIVDGLDWDQWQYGWDNTNRNESNQQYWWYEGEEIAGWERVEGRVYEIKNSGYNGVTAYEGNQFLDMNESPGHLALSQQFKDAPVGQKYEISFAAYDLHGNNQLEVLWGDEVIGVTEGVGREWKEFSFQFRAGEGDGENKLVIREVGHESNEGTYLDGVDVIPVSG